MKLFLVAALAILAAAHAEEEVEAQRLFGGSVTYNLYTSENPSTGQRLDVEDSRSFVNSNFDSRRPTILVTHGWRGNEQQSAVAVVRAAYIASGDYNVITIDWNAIQSIFSSPVQSVEAAGDVIIECVDLLIALAGLNPATTTLVGHSLGAHVVSYVARKASGTFQAVVGLDPAGPVFENTAEGIAIGIQSGDAAHVQVIHTNGGGMGLSRAAGDSDFYINGGSSQPGCILDLFGICAHFRAALIFAESITNPTGFKTSEDGSVFMGGASLISSARGSYTVTTNSVPPFALD